MNNVKRLLSLSICLSLVLIFGCETNNAPVVSPAEQEPTPRETTLRPTNAMTPVPPTDTEDAGMTAVSETPPAASQSTRPARALQCEYDIGDVQRIRYTMKHVYKNWVEMPERQPEQVRTRTSEGQLVMRREVEQVHADGSATMLVTFESADFSIHIKFPDKEENQTYTSNKQRTDSTWPGEPMLAGRTYRIRIAPDSTTEVLNRDDLLAKMAMSSQDSGTVAYLVSEENLRKYHEHDFLQIAPAPGGSADKAFSIPDDMIKAQAIEKTFATGTPYTENGQQKVKVEITGKPLHVLPEGLPEPPKPQQFGKKLIKDNSEMQDLVVRGEGILNLDTGSVELDDNALECYLVLMEENLFGAQARQKPGGGGLMLTEIKMYNTYTLLSEE